MKLSQIAAKPQLIKIELSDDEILAEFGEAIEFWTWDRQPLETFMRLANANQQDIGNMIDVIRTLILDENSHPIIAKDNMLPTNILMKVIAKIVEKLGK